MRTSEILDFLSDQGIDHSFRGNKEMEISLFSSISNVKANSITWIRDFTRIDMGDIGGYRESLIVTNKSGKEAAGLNVIVCDDPKRVFFGVLERFFQEESQPSISEYSVVETDKIGKNVSIGHHCTIGKDVTIGDCVVIGHNVSIICPATIGHHATIGCGVVIGTDGFGYYHDANGRNMKVPHFGGVSIGDNVDIGANTCIDRGTIDNTIIEQDVKIDNVCHIGHNCIIKKNSLLIAGTLLGGSCVIEENSYVAIGAMVKNKVTVGEDSIVGIGAVVTKDVPESTVAVGVESKYFPARYFRAGKSSLTK